MILMLCFRGKSGGKNPHYLITAGKFFFARLQKELYLLQPHYDAGRKALFRSAGLVTRVEKLSAKQKKRKKFRQRERKTYFNSIMKLI